MSGFGERLDWFFGAAADCCRRLLYAWLGAVALIVIATEFAAGRGLVIAATGVPLWLWIWLF